MIKFSEFRSQRLENLLREIKNKSYHHQRLYRPILEDGNVNKVSFEMNFKRNESLCLVLKPLKHTLEYRINEGGGNKGGLEMV